MNLHLSGKTALITGSTAGIGLAIAGGLLAEGVSVIVNGRSQARVDAAMKTLAGVSPQQSFIRGLAADLSTVEGARQAKAQFPEVDILINNLGMYEPKAFPEIADEDWDKLWQFNVMSGIRLSRNYLPAMLTRKWGRVIFISSESGVNIPTEMIHYGVTKTAQIALARGLAEMTVGTNVTVNSVLPGPTKSEGIIQFVKDLAESTSRTEAQVEKEFFQNVRPTSLLKRFATAEEVASTVVYLCSPLAAATNGAAVRADGGLLRGIL